MTPAIWELTPEEAEGWDFSANCCAPGRPCFLGRLIDANRTDNVKQPRAPARA